ncbi:MAG: hypothetical protein RLP44_21040 [Aggregatilineales bacterium]
MFKVDKRRLGWVVISALLLVQFVFLAIAIQSLFKLENLAWLLFAFTVLTVGYASAIYITIHPERIFRTQPRLRVIRYFMRVTIFYGTLILISLIAFMGLGGFIFYMPYVIIGVTLLYIVGFLVSDPVAFEGVNVFGLFAVLLGVAIPMPFNAILYLGLVIAKWWEQDQSIENRERRWTDGLTLLTIVLGAACFFGPLPSVFDEILVHNQLSLQNVSIFPVMEAARYTTIESIIIDAAVLLLRFLVLLIPVWVISEVRKRKLIELTPKEWQNLAAFVGVTCIVAFIGVALWFAL